MHPEVIHSGAACPSQGAFEFAVETRLESPAAGEVRREIPRRRQRADARASEIRRREFPAVLRDCADRQRDYLSSFLLRNNAQPLPCFARRLHVRQRRPAVLTGQGSGNAPYGYGVISLSVLTEKLKTPDVQTAALGLRQNVPDFTDEPSFAMSAPTLP